MPHLQFEVNQRFKKEIKDISANEMKKYHVRFIVSIWLRMKR